MGLSWPQLVSGVEMNSRITASASSGLSRHTPWPASLNTTRRDPGICFGEFFLVTNGDERIELARQDQGRAADPGNLGEEIEPTNLISPEVQAHLFAKDRSREHSWIRFAGV